jgi:wyosine [tRNA(Phe)-imidazoG37] synthetase (radical SAM superfamily)
MRYVYPVVSRRAGGVSLGINLNTNNACNWRCIYCQVPELRRGAPPPIDLVVLARELDALLVDILERDFFARRVPPDARRLIDVAFSGNGEPTSAADFPAAVEVAIAALARRSLLGTVKLRLITNGSLLDRATTRAGIARLGEVDGEVWFKVDAVSENEVRLINGARPTVANVRRRLSLCSELCPTWVQTCLFSVDGQLPSDEHLDSLAGFLAPLRDRIRGIHLYGYARPSAQVEAPRLGRVPSAWLEAVGVRLRTQGLTVEVSP